MLKCWTLTVAKPVTPKSSTSCDWGLPSKRLGWRFNLPSGRKAGWSLNIHMKVLLWREVWGHGTVEHCIFWNNSTRQDRWTFTLRQHTHTKRLFLMLSPFQGRRSCMEEEQGFYYRNRNAGWHLDIRQRMVRKSSSQRNTIKRFISLDRVILGWDMISVGFGLSQAISGREGSVIVSTA